MDVYIRLGSIGGAVVTLQERLGAHGHKVPVTGFADPATMTAAETFQKKHRIHERGVVTAETWGALEAEPEQKPKPKHPAEQKVPAKGADD